MRTANDTQASAERARPPRRRRRTAEVARREILDATRDVLRDRGGAELSVETLMAAAGMKRPNFYHYFGDLTDVLMCLLDEAQDELLASATGYITGTSLGPQGLADAIRASSETWARHRDILLAVHDGTGDPRIAERYRAVTSEWANVTAARLRAERRAGRTNVKRPDAVASALTLMNINVFAERLGRGRESPALVASVLIQIWIGAIYPDAEIDRRGRERTRGTVPSARRVRAAPTTVVTNPHDAA